MWQVGWGNWFLWLREIFQLVNYCKRDFIIWFAVNNCSGGSAFDLIFKYFKANFLKLFFIFILFLLSEPSAAEKKAQEMIFKKQEACQKCLAEKYCTLVLGLNTKKYHHLGCGRFDIYFMFPFFLFFVLFFGTAIVSLQVGHPFLLKLEFAFMISYVDCLTFFIFEFSDSLLNYICLSFTETVIKTVGCR